MLALSFCEDSKGSNHDETAWRVMAQNLPDEDDWGELAALRSTFHMMAEFLASSTRGLRAT